MRKTVFFLGLIFLFLSNQIAFAANIYDSIFYAVNTNVHWAVPYAKNVGQRLASIKGSLSGDNAHIDTETIDRIIAEVLQPEQLDDTISSVNWKAFLVTILGVEETEIDFLNESLNNDPIRREDAIASAMKILEEKMDLDFSQLNTVMPEDKFSDMVSVEEEKAAFVSLAVNEGIIAGYNDESLRPKQYVRNCEAITIIEKICSKYGLPEVQWTGNINLQQIDGYIKVHGPQAIEEAFWTNDNGVLMVYNAQDSLAREAAKVFPESDKTVKALEYDQYNISESLLNANAFKDERGYISVNKIVWNKNRRYINKDGELKTIEIPYVNYWISDDNRMVLMQDEENRTVKLYDFLTENSIEMDEYYRWADRKYNRAIKWSPDSRYLVSTLFKPEDDIGIGEKNRFAVFDCQNGKLMTVIHERGYYAFYPAWSPDGSKIAFFRVKMDDAELKLALNNMIDHRFNLPVSQIGVYDLTTKELTYYPHPESVILGRYEGGIVWAPAGDQLYIETASDKDKFLIDLHENPALNFAQVPNDVWALDLKKEVYEKLLSGKVLAVQKEPALEEILSAQEVFGQTEEPLENPSDLHEEIMYAVTKRIYGISSNNSRILYATQSYNLSRHENIPARFTVQEVESGIEKPINEKELIHYWWLNDGRLIFVESEMIPRSRNAKITYRIKEIDKAFNIREIATFIQFPTAISMSPNKQHLMLHQYRGDKDVKIIRLN
ncbi:MAG: hypothetical protein MJB12_04835 [Firmicutes bacterium]|nr:hypothetical protein [Bacillota bacterium]